MAEQTTHVNIEVQLEVQKNEAERLKRQLADLQKQLGRYKSLAGKSILKKGSIIDPKAAADVDRFRGSLSRLSEDMAEKKWRRVVDAGDFADNFRRARREVEGFQRRIRNAGGFKSLDADAQKGAARALKRMRLLEYAAKRLGQEIDVLADKEKRKASEVGTAENNLARRRQILTARYKREQREAADSRVSAINRVLREELRSAVRQHNIRTRLQRQQADATWHEAQAENRAFDARRRLQWLQALADNRAFDARRREAERIRRQTRGDVEHHLTGAGRSGHRALQSMDQPYFHSPVFYMTAAGAAAGVAMAEAFQHRLRNQNAEKMLEVFGDYGRFDDSKPFAQRNPNEVKEMRRAWIDRMAITYGLSGDRALDAVAEGRKAGIPKEHIEELTKQAFQLSHALEADIKEATHLMGISFSLLGKGGNGLEAVRGMNNAIAVAAQASAADANEVVAAMRRGAGALSYGMNYKDLAALSAAGVSAGIQSGKSGTLVVRMLDELITAPNQGKERQSDMRRGLRTLGIRGDLKGIAQKVTKDPGAFIDDLLTRASKLDPTRRVQALNDLFQDLWGNEANQITQAIDAYFKTKSAVYDPAKQDLLATISGTKLTTFDSMLKSARSAFDLMWEDLGSGMDQMFTDAAVFFTQMGLGRQGLRLGEMMRRALTGMVNGFGFDSLGDLLHDLFPSAGTSEATLGNIYKFFRGLAEGLKSVFAPVFDFFRDATGQIDYAQMGKAIGTFVGLTAVLQAARPFLALAGGAASLAVGAGHLVLLGLGLKKLATISRFMRSGRTAAAAPGLLSRTFAGIGRALAGPGLAGALGRFSGSVLGAFSRVFSVMFWIWLGTRIAQFIYSNWGTIKPAVKGALQAFWSGFLETFKAAIKEVFMLEDFKTLGEIVRKKAGIPETLNPDGSTKPRAFPMFLYPDFWKGKSPTPNQLPHEGLGPVNPGSLQGQGEALKQHYLNGSSGSNEIKGGAGFDDLSSTQSLGYQSATTRNLEQMNQKFDTLIRLVTFDGGRFGQLHAFTSAARSAGDFSYGSAYNGPNRHLLRPGMRGGTPGVGGQGTIAGRSFGGSGGAARAAKGGIAPLGGPSGTGNGSLSPAGALDEASKYLGMNEYRDTGALKSFMNGWDPRGAANAWCAQFMNASLESQGIKGTGSALASSFLNWGQQVLDPAQAQKGDILVDHRGRQAGQQGAHVGMFTGQTRQGPRGLQMEMLGGNQGDAVTKQWVDAGKLAIRRASVGQKAAQAVQGAAQAATQAFEAPANAASLPAGMRNNNPGNLKYTGSALQQSLYPGMIGPSRNTDQGDPQIVFKSAADGLTAMSNAIGYKAQKYGFDTVNKMITTPGKGWTPGNVQAAANVAGTMGVGPNDRLDFGNPDVRKRFMRALMLQEHGPASKAYTDDDLNRAVQRSMNPSRFDALKTQVPSQTQPNSIELQKPQTPDALIRDVPSANGTGGGQKTTNNQFGGPQTNIHIHGGNMDHHQMAAQVQRRISEVWTRRTNDLETDIA